MSLPNAQTECKPYEREVWAAVRQNRDSEGVCAEEIGISEEHVRLLTEKPSATFNSDFPVLRIAKFRMVEVVE